MVNVDHAAPAQKLLTYWRTQERPLVGEPASELDLQRFERAFGVVLPPCLRAYYMTANGLVPPREQDDEGFSFWPLSRVRPVDSDEAKSSSGIDVSRLFVFADYLSWCWGYAVKLTNGSSSEVYIVGTEDGIPKRLAASFSDFVNLYTGRSITLHG